LVTAPASAPTLRADYRVIEFAGADARSTARFRLDRRFLLGGWQSHRSRAAQTETPA